jgi:hypothetical protein
MSAATPATIIDGSVLYSTRATSAAFFARVAVTSFDEVSLPPPTSVWRTWMSGCALFHASTNGSCVVPQAQYSSVMGPSPSS